MVTNNENGMRKRRSPEAITSRLSARMKSIKKTARQIQADNLQRSSPLRDDFILMAHNIRSLHNVGSLFRSADAFGVCRLWLTGYTPRPPRAEISKTALGAEEHVPWSAADRPEAVLTDLRHEGYRIYGLEQTLRSESLLSHRPPSRKICLIIGNEVTGIDEALFPLIDEFVEIPQFGMKHSLNVSVAAGVALYAFLEKLA